MYHTDVSAKHVPSRSHCDVYDLTSISSGGATDEKAAEQMTAIQDCVSTSASVKPLDIFNKASRQFPAVFVATKPDI